MKNLIFAVFTLLLMACATQPSGNHNFSVAPAGAKKGSWSLDHLSTHGRIELTGHLFADSGRAARIAIKFGTADVNISLAELVFSDQSCEGAYTMALSHMVKADSETIDYLNSKLAWESPLQLQAEWWPDGRFTLTINGLESKTVQINKPVDDLVVEAYLGEVRVDNLNYRDLNTR